MESSISIFRFYLLFCLLNMLDSAATDGIVYVVSPQGKEVATIMVEGPEISGLVVRSVLMLLVLSREFNKRKTIPFDTK